MMCPNPSRASSVAPASMLFATVVILSTPAHAQTTWCVSNTPTPLSDVCPAETCADGDDFPTIASALDAIRVAVASDSLLFDLQHQICIRGLDLQVETTTIDASDGSLPLSLNVSLPASKSANLCPDPASDAEEPMFDLIGPAAGDPLSVGIDFLFTESTACAANRPLARISHASLSLNSLRVIGGADGTFELSDMATLSVSSSRIQDLQGPILTGAGEAEFQESELASNLVEDGRPLLGLSGGALRLAGSALFGNAVSGGAPLIDVVGSFAIDGGLVAGNVVGDSAPLIRASTTALDGGTEYARVRDAVISRNVLGTSSNPVPAPSLIRGIGPVGGSFSCLPEAADGLNYVDRAAASLDGPSGTAALLQIVPSSVALATVFVSQDSWWVENELSGPVFEVVAGPSSVDLTLLQNTIEVPAGLFIDGSSAPFGSHFTAARNLIVGPAEYRMGPGWNGFEASMELFTQEDAPLVTELPAVPSLQGPYFGLGQTEVLFMDESDVMPLGPCERLFLLCPEAIDECMAGEALTHGSPQCGLDRAIGWLQTLQPAFGVAEPWPWGTVWFERAERGALANRSGAGPRSCVDMHPGHHYDRALTASGVDGDADGFTSLTDCQNDSPEFRPALPLEDGYRSLSCEADEFACYLCPPPIAGDDDDSADADDDDSATGDDDSASLDDDDSAEDAPQPPPVSSSPGSADCSIFGCGVAWSPSTGLASACLFLLPLRRRRSCG